MKIHHYQMNLEWTGNQGVGTASYQAYTRTHLLGGAHKGSHIEGSSDPAFRGDPSRYNPEELLVGSLSACHMLWYLHLCSANGVVVTAYTDAPEGSMVEEADGGGQFTEVVLRPQVWVREAAMQARAAELHEEAHRLCFIARSCRFEVRCEGVVWVAAE